MVKAAQLRLGGFLSYRIKGLIGQKVGVKTSINFCNY